MSVAPAPDTIVAAATAPGRAGIAIVRASGPAVPALLPALLAQAPAARVATNVRFRAADGHAIDSGLALYFPAPHSYTGEHVLELHGHGGPVLVEALIRRVLELGARRAGPGEFTQRAYLNGKLDLAQAEAVASLIEAASEAAARAALRSLEGEFSRRVLELREQLGTLRAWIEAGIDFAEDEIDFLSDERLQSRLEAVAGSLRALTSASRRGRLLTEGMTVVIAGRPNAGKSTLLNRLVGHEAAIVTALPGTTRDVLRERIVLDGLPLEVLDTAGLRDGSADAIEQEGIRRAQAAMARADRILFVVDAAEDPDATAYRVERSRLPSRVPVTVLFSKIDLQQGPQPARPLRDMPGLPVMRLSALTGEGMVDLISHLKECMGFTDADDTVIAARARHLEALAHVETHVGQARLLLAARHTSELLAEELRHAQQALGEIVGEQSSDELLGRIFASFCIGK